MSFYSVVCFSAILFVHLESNEVPFFHDASECGSTATHAVVKHRVTFVGVRSYKTFSH